MPDTDNEDISDLFVKHSNLYKSQVDALKDTISDISTIIANADISLSSLKLVDEEIHSEYDKFLKFWIQYEAHILDKSSLYASANREFRQLKRQAFNLLNTGKCAWNEYMTVKVTKSFKRLKKIDILCPSINRNSLMLAEISITFSC